MKTKASEIAKILLNAKAVAVIGHVDPDGDCLGSMYALTLALQALGKTAVPLLKKPIPIKHRNFSDLLFPNSEAPKNCDLVVILDTPEEKRQDFKNAELPSVPKICIDHHQGLHADYDAAFYQEDAPATVLLILALLHELKVTITPKIAEALYVGLLTDTNAFTNGNTTPEVFKAALELTESGANPGKIASLVYQSRTPFEIATLAKVLGTLETYCEEKIAVLSMPYEWQKNNPPCDTELFVNFARSLKDSEIAVMLIGTEEGTRVNLRSKGEADVSLAAKAIGGGGHRAAAGCRLNVPLAEAKIQVLEALKKYSL